MFLFLAFALVLISVIAYLLTCKLIQWSHLNVVFRALLGIIAFCFLSYGCVHTTLGMWTLPSKEKQIGALEQEMCLADIERTFIPLEEREFKYTVLKTYQCSKRFHVLGNVEKTKNKFIEIHEKEGWKIDVEDRGFPGEHNVAMLKNHIRAYCVFIKGENDLSIPVNVEEYFLIIYKYRDGYLVK